MRVLAAFANAVMLICLGAPVHAWAQRDELKRNQEPIVAAPAEPASPPGASSKPTLQEKPPQQVPVADPIASEFASEQKRGFDAEGPLAEDKIVNIPANSGIRDIAELLQREGVIDKPWIFVAGALAMKIQGRGDLKAGEYKFKKQASIREVVETLIQGKGVLHFVTVAEGLTSEQIVQRLMESEILNGNVKEIPREGTLLPETYKINRGTPREQLLQRMQQAQRRVLQEIWDRRNSDLPVKTPEQLVILASIIERETGRPDERTRVAAVFVNRLKRKMKLQSDPTIIYGLVGGKGSLGRPLLRSEIGQPTPYNTYVIDGLPPGPIANPGRASLEAAANPAPTKELYFVADGTGGHAFAETSEQHQKNAARLRAIEHEASGQLSP
jgi:UPF0755 protein